MDKSFGTHELNCSLQIVYTFESARNIDEKCWLKGPWESDGTIIKHEKYMVFV